MLTAQILEEMIFLIHVYIVNIIKIRESENFVRIASVRINAGPD